MSEYYDEKPKAGCIAIIISFILPIVGFIIYALQRNKVGNPNAYLFAAFAGIIVDSIGALTI